MESATRRTIEGEVARIEFERDEIGRPVSGRGLVEKGGGLAWTDVLRVGDVGLAASEELPDGSLRRVIQGAPSDAEAPEAIFVYDPF